jgi:mono/diheme cytochrome c family protein
MKKTTYTLIAFGAVAFAFSAMFSSCAKEDPNSPGIEYMPDMYRSPSVETNGVNMWVNDTIHMGNMLPPAGTVPRGFTPFPYENTPVGDSLASAFWKSPMQHSDSIEEKGKALFERFCIYCHGPKGDGQGPLVASGKYSSQPPSYLKLFADGKLTDGHIYHVITYGKGNMGSHAQQVSPEERWMIIQYVERLGRGGDAWSVYSKKMQEQAAMLDTAKTKAPAKMSGGGKANPK